MRAAYIAATRNACVVGVYNQGMKYNVAGFECETPREIAEVVEREVVSRNLRRVVLFCSARTMMNLDAVLGDWYEKRMLVAWPEHQDMDLIEVVKSSKMDTCCERVLA